MEIITSEMTSKNFMSTATIRLSGFEKFFQSSN